MSKDPIGLLGGLHNTKYVSDPNLWVDPLGLTALVYGARATLTWIAVDAAVPEPTDLAWPKWVGYGVAGAAAGGILYMAGESDVSCSTASDLQCQRKKRCKKWGTGTPKQAQQKVRVGQGSRGVGRIDRPEESVPGSQWHAHAIDGSTLNLDGTIHDNHRWVSSLFKR